MSHCLQRKAVPVGVRADAVTATTRSRCSGPHAPVATVTGRPQPRLEQRASARMHAGKETDRVAEKNKLIGVAAITAANTAIMAWRGFKDDE